MEYSLGIKKYIIGIIWSVLFFCSIISLFIFTHELTHVIRFNEPEMMCMGFGDNLGLVIHYNPFTDTQYNHEELMANLVASIVCLIYMAVSFYMIAYFRFNLMKGGIK